MNRIFMVFFALCAAVIGLWLLTDDDAPAASVDDVQDVPPVKNPIPSPQTLSKSA